MQVIFTYDEQHFPGLAACMDQFRMTRSPEIFHQAADFGYAGKDRTAAVVHKGMQVMPSAPVFVQPLKRSANEGYLYTEIYEPGLLISRRQPPRGLFCRITYMNGRR